MFQVFCVLFYWQWQGLIYLLCDAACYIVMLYCIAVLAYDIIVNSCINAKSVCKIVPKMTCDVLSGTLNSAIQYIVVK